MCIIVNSVKVPTILSIYSIMSFRTRTSDDDPTITSKRRRLVDTAWSKPNNNKRYTCTGGGLPVNAYLNNSSNSIINNNNTNIDDAMEDLGRRHWHHCNTLPIESRPLATSCYMGKWCYFAAKRRTRPTMTTINHHQTTHYQGEHNNNHHWELIKVYGTPGEHYAMGYKQLGEMIIKYGSDYSIWPALPGHLN